VACPGAGGFGTRPASRCEYGESSVEASGDYSADGRHAYCRHDRCMVLVAEADCLCGLRSGRRGQVAKNTEQGKEMSMGHHSDLTYHSEMAGLDAMQ